MVPANAQKPVERSADKSVEKSTDKTAVKPDAEKRNNEKDKAKTSKAGVSASAS